MGRTKRIDLEALLDEALEDLHHNATLGGKLQTESDYEDDLLRSCLEDETSFALAELHEEFPWLRSKFGRFYQYGRGGRTVMPERLAVSHRYSSAVKARDLEGLEPFEYRKLLKELRRFNKHVKDWCSSAPDSCLEFIREEYSEELKERKGKTRKTRVVTTYE